MARKPLLECSFLIPIRRDRNLSDGKPHKKAAWRWLEDRLHDHFRGATRAGELTEGWYEDPDTAERVRDRSQKYTVAVPRDQLGLLRAVLCEACSKFAQKCIYLSVAGHVEFVEGANDASSG